MRQHYTSDSALINDLTEFWGGRAVRSAHNRYNTVGEIWKQIDGSRTPRTVYIVDPRDDSIFTVTFQYEIHTQ